MPLPHPCCGALPLQLATRICAGVHVILHVLVMFSVLAGFGDLMWDTFLRKYPIMDADIEYSYPFFISLFFAFVLTVAVGLQIAGGVLLYFAAVKKDMKRVKTWCIAATVLFAICIVISFMHFINMVRLKYVRGIPGWGLMGACGLPLATPYFVFVAWAFREQETRGSGAVPASGVMQPAPVYGQSSKTQASAKANDTAPDYSA